MKQCWWWNQWHCLVAQPVYIDIWNIAFQIVYIYFTYLSKSIFESWQGWFVYSRLTGLCIGSAFKKLAEGRVWGKSAISAAGITNNPTLYRTFPSGTIVAVAYHIDIGLSVFPKTQQRARGWNSRTGVDSWSEQLVISSIYNDGPALWRLWMKILARFELLAQSPGSNFKAIPVSDPIHNVTSQSLLNAGHQDPSCAWVGLSLHLIAISKMPFKELGQSSVLWDTLNYCPCPLPYPLSSILVLSNSMKDMVLFWGWTGKKCDQVLAVGHGTEFNHSAHWSLLI